jgi:hypothetical protein
MLTQLLSSGEFCKLRYDTIPVKSASANVSFYTSNSKMLNFELWHSVPTRRSSDLMYSAWKTKNNYDMSASVFVVQFNGFMSLTS